MPRLPRLVQIGYYHVFNRGVEKRKVFIDALDYVRFLSLVNEQSKQNEQRAQLRFNIKAFCLMPNHYHLLLEMKDKSLSLVMKHIDQEYSQYFNKKYDRVGSLWQGRFQSRYVFDKRYLGVLMKYIEQNPIKAGMSLKIGEYPWASSNSKDSNLSTAELAQLNEFFCQNGVRPPLEFCPLAPNRQKSLSEHFGPLATKLPRTSPLIKEQNQAILAALQDGYQQSDIARYLGLSDSAISRRKRGLTPICASQSPMVI